MSWDRNRLLNVIVSAAAAAAFLCGSAILVGAQCASPAADDAADARCPSLAAVCPSLSCVEPRRGDDGCPVCECVVQACAAPADCADRGINVLCDASARFCEPGPGCTDDDDGTTCPAACYGRCLYAGDRSRSDGYCSRDDDCAGGQSCHQTTCVDDPTTPFFDCIGWCVDGCPEVETPAFDPVNGFCVVLPDGCLPPGWSSDGCR
jgi:hypothetical protein